MTKLYSRTVALNTDIVDAFCVQQKGFNYQFVYYDKERPIRYLGLGRCIALATLGEADVVSQDAGFAPVFFSFNRFDAENPKPADDMMTAEIVIDIRGRDLACRDGADDRGWSRDAVAAGEDACHVLYA